MYSLYNCNMLTVKKKECSCSSMFIVCFTLELLRVYKHILVVLGFELGLALARHV
jgi:hypothetical protein